MEDSKKSFNNFHDSYLRQYIQQADTKASWLFAANSAILLWASGNEIIVKFVKSNQIDFVSFIIVFSCLLLLISCGLLFDAIRARSMFSNEVGVLYFDHVSKFKDHSDYIAKIYSMSDSDVFEERLKAQYAMSVICSRKYMRISIASILSVISIFVFVILRIYFLYAI